VSKHVIQQTSGEQDSLFCQNCQDQLDLSNEAPLWMQLAVKDAFVSLHAACPLDHQARPTIESLTYERHG
jgi:hypothetical protein